MMVVRLVVWMAVTRAGKSVLLMVENLVGHWVARLVEG